MMQMFIRRKVQNNRDFPDQLKRSVDKFCYCVAVLSTVCTATQENQTKSLNYLVF